jgi:hypothetical protein
MSGAISFTPQGAPSEGFYTVNSTVVVRDDPVRSGVPA